MLKEGNKVNLNLAFTESQADANANCQTEMNAFDGQGKLAFTDALETFRYKPPTFGFV